MSNVSTMNELRDSIAEQLEKVKNGETTPASANAFANLSGKLLGSIKLELEYNKMIGATPNIDFIKSANSPKKLEIDTSSESIPKS